MSKQSLLSLLAVALLLTGTVVAEDKPDFSGDWVLDREATDLAGSNLFLAKITIVQTGDSLLTVRTYENRDGEQYPFNEKLTLDGKEYKIIIYDMPRTTAAMWSEEGIELLINSSVVYWTDNGEEQMDIAEVFMLEDKGARLKIDSSSKTPSNEYKALHIYKKIEKEQ